MSFYRMHIFTSALSRIRTSGSPGHPFRQRLLHATVLIASVGLAIISVRGAWHPARVIQALPFAALGGLLLAVILPWHRAHVAAKQREEDIAAATDWLRTATPTEAASVLFDANADDNNPDHPDYVSLVHPFDPNHGAYYLE
jgi:hypothetical protein